MHLYIANNLSLASSVSSLQSTYEAVTIIKHRKLPASQAPNFYKIPIRFHRPACSVELTYVSAYRRLIVSFARLSEPNRTSTSRPSVQLFKNRSIGTESISTKLNSYDVRARCKNDNQAAVPQDISGTVTRLSERQVHHAN